MRLSLGSRWNPAAKPLVFQITAVLFLLFALPCFLFVREPRRLDAKPLGLETLRAAIGELSHTMRRVGQYPGLGRFLIGRVFYADAANTLRASSGMPTRIASPRWRLLLP